MRTKAWDSEWVAGNKDGIVLVMMREHGDCGLAWHNASKEMASLDHLAWYTRRNNLV